MTRLFNHRTIWIWFTAAAIFLAAVFLLYPVLNLLTGSISGGRNGWAILLSEPRYTEAIRNSLLLGVIVTLTSVAVGVPLAYFTARYDFPGKGIVTILPLITIVVPEVISAQTWLMLLGNNGIITKWFLAQGVRLPSFYGWPGLTIAMTFAYYTYVYIGTLAAVKGFDIQLEEAAQSLGTPPAKARLHVLVPVIMPAILSSGLLVFTLVIGNFATATILGGRVRLLSVLTYQSAVAEGGGDRVMQSTLASTAVGLILAVLFLQRWIVSRGRHQIVQGRHARPQRLGGLRGRLGGLAVAVPVVLSLLPLVTLLAGSFTVQRGPVTRWGEWTTANFERLFTRFPDAITNTLLYSATAVAIAIAFSTLASYLIVKKKNVLTPVLDYLVVLPLALSGTAIGIGLLMAFGTGGLIPLGGTGAIIVLAYIARRLPFGVRNASSTLYNIPDSIEEASISLGVPPVRSFLKAVLPVMAPAIAAAAVLTWTTTVAELSASIIVYSGGRETMPIEIFKLIDSGLMGQASAYGVLLIAVILLPIIVATKVFKVDLFST
ncbi:iron ABC transporter permease [Paracoccus sp. APAP_BH8]|uniref:Iron ABC transporter permease n=1 Tax=Paracoccus pantotrophus TaxID=82367 RepID=A0A7H9C0G7_PARPN|nr:iron ABC transporter permease [Paracoccus pantotrophus]QLH16902.1 iron ABC transporter permease [Paracoccus pantotrophus]RNI14290.1 iron ABC transporter permease [Paracoccus pantotrophus]